MKDQGKGHRAGRASALFLLGSVAVAACHPTRAEYDEVQRQKAELQRQLNDTSAERTRLQGELDGLSTRASDLEHRLGESTGDRERLQREGAQTQSELEAARAREAELRRRQQQQEARLSVFRNMLEQFRSMISAGQLRVRVVRGRMVIELPAGILFDSGRAELKPEGQQVLRQVASVLAQIRGRDFLVAGHTDNQRITRGGRYEDNWDLSTARSATVVRFLAANQVPTDHLGAAGYAEFQPARENDTDENRAQNRRVEIVLMPNIEELPDLSSLDGAPAQAPHTPPAPAAPAH